MQLNTILSLIAGMMLIGMISYPAQADRSPKDAELIALKFFAEWCGTCREMGPIFTDLKNVSEGSPVAFYQLDFTNSATTSQSLLMASALGISQVVTANEGTGFILLVDLETKEVVERLTINHSLKDMAGKVRAHM